jgi:hypothetical protein
LTATSVAPRIAARRLPGATLTPWVARVRLAGLAVRDRVADDVGDVLVQGAAAGDVEDLAATADREDRHVALERGADESELEGVERRLGGAELWVRRGAVRVGMEVRAARQADAVDAVEQRRDHRPGHRRHDRRERAGPAEGLEVAHPEHHLPARRVGLGGRRVERVVAHLRRGDGDERRDLGGGVQAGGHRGNGHE